ncbi:MAG: hypothetical protein K6E16_04505, partial [Lachnospiraceae bacterium]|nr:hypothetical protein [Lachnospiraceae bacterium]
MKKDTLKFISVLLCYVMLFNCFTFPVMAEELPYDPVLSGAEETSVSVDEAVSGEMTVPAETVASEDEELLPEVDETGEAEEYDDPDPGQKQFTVRVRKQNEDDYGQSIDDSDFDTPEEVDAYISGLADDSCVDVVINFIGEGETLVLDPDNMSENFEFSRKREIRFSGDVEGKIEFRGFRQSLHTLGLDIRSDGFVIFTDCYLCTLNLYNTKVQFCSANTDNAIDKRSHVNQIQVYDVHDMDPSEIDICNMSLDCNSLSCNGCDFPVFSVSPGVRFGDFHIQTVWIYCGHDEYSRSDSPSDMIAHTLWLRDYCGDAYPDENGPVIHIHRTVLCDIEDELYDTKQILPFISYVNPESTTRVLDVETLMEGRLRHIFCTISDPHEIVEIDYQDELGKVAGAMLAGDTIDLRDYERVFERMKDGSERVMRRVYSLSYDSADPGVATVNEEGILTAHGVGQTVVTVTSNENPQVTRRIDVKVMEPVTNVTIGCDKTDIKRISKTSLTAEVTPYSENINPEIRWSVLAKEGDGEEYAADDFATITTVSTNGAVTVGELKVNTKKTAQELENLQLKVRATAAGGQGDTVFAEKTFTVSDTAPITGIVLTPESQIVSAVSATVIKATLLPEDQITDPGLEWTVCPMEGKTELEDLDAEDFYIRPDPEKPEATLYVHTTTVSTRGAIDVVRVKATSKSARDGNGRPLVGSTDIVVSPVIVPDQIRFDKKKANVCYGEDVTYNITASVAGADPEVSIALFECTYNNGNRVLSRITTPGPYHITSTKDKDHTKISFSTDPEDGNNRKHTLVIRATSTYAFKGGRNDSSYYGDYLIYDETEIRLNNRYYLEEDVLNPDVGDIHTLKLYDHKTGKPVKAAEWRSAGESLVTAASDGTIKALHAGTTQVIPLKKEGTELIPYQTEDGRMVSATVYVRDMVEAPTATVSPARSDGLRIGDVITLETPTNGATIKYTTAPASLPDENYSPTNPIEVTLAKTLPINGRSDARQLTVKTKAQTVWVSSATRTYTYLVYLDLGPGQTGDVTPADVADAGGVERIPDGLWMSKIAPQCYTGEKIVPDVRVYHGKKMLVEGSDYTVAVSNNVKAHDATVNGTSPTLTVSFKNGYSGKLKQTFAIDQIDLADEAVLVSNYEASYTGSVQKIVPAVTYNGKTLKNNTDFTVEYPDTEAGAYQEPNAGRIGETYHGYAIRLKA